MSKKANRLSSLFDDLKNKFEFDGKIDSDGLGAEIGIPDHEKTIFVSYAFDPSQDSYEFGTALGQIDEEHILAVASEVMFSQPIRGITERIDDQGRFIVTGSRDGLQNLPDIDVQKGYMDDVSRISESNEQFKGILGRLFKNDG